MNKIFEEKLRRPILHVRLDFEYLSEALNSLKVFEPKVDIWVLQNCTYQLCKTDIIKIGFVLPINKEMYFDWSARSNQSLKPEIFVCLRVSKEQGTAKSCLSFLTGLYAMLISFLILMTSYYLVLFDRNHVEEKQINFIFS